MPTAISTTEQPPILSAPQPPPSSTLPSLPPPQVYAAPPVTAVLTILIMVLFFVGFFFLYFCKCFMENVINNMNNHHQPSAVPDAIPNATTGATEPQGLDQSIINTFPTFPYSSVKGYRREKYGLECAICLCEFDDDDLLRLLIRCCHVFHQQCIDLWLESHRSCPVCRRSLDATNEDEVKTPESAPAALTIQSDATTLSADDVVSIVIKDDGDDEVGDRGGGRRGVAVDDDGDGGGNGGGVVQFSRSHSTGHSILRTEEVVDDKYTLRLPEKVKERLMLTRRHHQATASCTTFVEFSRNSTRPHDCFGEISGSCTSTSGGGGGGGTARASVSRTS